MILVLLGTQPLGFPRLLAAVDELIGKGVISDPVIAQCGHTKYASDRMRTLDFLPNEEFRRLVGRADAVVTHGGVGSILNCVKAGKKVIAAPRMKRCGEHVNDHQVQIVRAFHDKGYIKGVFDMRDLEPALSGLADFVPKPYVSNTERVMKIVADFIDAR
ncbi:MAG: beta(1,3)galactosyltransferase EpsH [Clostridiales Family XIII bacterium]|jgi:UDP-N-acetylglucosamine transferase subunit ALG13|nr:beta(1,3)galactosyltransferase EpsH [Clostridiales Family XIII bacterium]